MAFGAAKSEDVGLIVCAISFRDFQPTDRHVVLILVIHQRYRQYRAVFEKTCAIAQKNVKKSCFLDFQKKRKKAAFNYSIREVGTGKSRSPTSNILLRSADTRNYATENGVCDKCL